MGAGMANSRTLAHKLQENKRETIKLLEPVGGALAGHHVFCSDSVEPSLP